ncbi:MAG: sodium:calcium antiporter [Peptococcaceae bacterium]|nr:sodium:calcium antiporter [Peptococcaceae bacterium]
MKDVFFLVLSLGIILLGADLFTNGVEWLGKKLNLGDGAVGSVLAAVGTALPETIIPIIAIFSHSGAAGQDVGIGAILGAPFMLGTLALFVIGSAVFFFRRSNRAMYINCQVMLRDIRFFLLVYSLAIIASFIPVYSLKLVVVAVLLGAYITYVFKTVRSSYGAVDTHEDLLPCYFAKRSKKPSMLTILSQILFSVLIIVAGAELFVSSVQEVSLSAGIPVLVLSLIITPVATELPEKFNSILWARRGKDTLALGNITGAMVFQSSVIPALGIAFTPWVLEPLALISALLVLGSAALQYFFLSKNRTLFPAGLLLGGVFYGLFILSVIRNMA